MLKIIFLSLFAIGIIGMVSISSQTAFATEMELMKLLPNDSVTIFKDYNNSLKGESLEYLFVNDNQKSGVIIAKSNSIDDAWTLYKIYAESESEIKRTEVKMSDGKCFKSNITIEEFNTALICIVDNEYVIRVHSPDSEKAKIMMTSIIKKIDDSIILFGGYDDEVTVTITEEVDENTWGSELEAAQQGGGCLIATATYGSEMALEVQQLRELRDNQLLNTESGTAFMGTFNDIYYSFSPIIADYERENPYFKEVVKIAITPMISSLSLMENANSESEVLGIGLSVIMLNIGMYLGLPAVVIVGIRKK